MARRNDFDDTALTMLFGEPEPEPESNGGIIELPLEDLLPFHTGGGHPFEVKEDAAMRALEDDMRENGQLEPAYVRKEAELEGRYELLAGHRRAYVAKKIGQPKLKAIIVDYDDVRATKLMVVTNLQKREEIKPSEKAKAYKMYLDANKRQAGRPKKSVEKNSSKLETNLRESEENSCQVGTNFRADEQAAEEFGESARNIQRYVRLNELIPPLLEMIDKKEMKMGVGVELSYLDKSEQEVLLEHIKEGYMPTLEEAKEFKKSRLVADIKKKQPKTPKEKKPKLNERFINEYLPEPMRKMDVEKKRAYTQAALIMYNNYLLEHPEEQAEWA